MTVTVIACFQRERRERGEERSKRETGGRGEERRKRGEEKQTVEEEEKKQTSVKKRRGNREWEGFVVGETCLCNLSSFNISMRFMYTIYA